MQRIDDLVSTGGDVLKASGILARPREKIAAYQEQLVRARTAASTITSDVATSTLLNPTALLAQVSRVLCVLGMD